MRRIWVHTTALSVFFLVFCNMALAENPWKFVTEDDGINRYVRDVEGSKFAEYKGVTVIDADMAQVGAVFRDILKYPKWMASISDAQIIRKHNVNDMDIYFVLDFPWPASDRDTVLMTRTHVDPDTGVVIIRTKDFEDPEMPEQKGLVRIPYLLQFFTLRYVDTNKTEVSYSVHLEAGGNLPATAVEMDLKNAPYKSLKNLRNFIHEDKYWNANPMDAVNFETTKTILGFNLRQYIKDEEMVQLLLSDKSVIKKLIENGHSEIGRKKNATIIARAYVKSPLFQKRIQKSENADILARLGTDDALVEDLLNDDGFVNLIIESGKTGMTDKIKADIVSMIKIKMNG